jgi:hypothetical protein
MSELPVKTCGRPDPHLAHSWATVSESLDLTRPRAWDSLGDVPITRQVWQCRGRLMDEAGLGPQYRVRVTIEPEPGLDNVPGLGQPYTIAMSVSPEIAEPRSVYETQSALETVAVDAALRLAADYHDLQLQDLARKRGLTYLTRQERWERHYGMQADIYPGEPIEDRPVSPQWHWCGEPVAHGPHECPPGQFVGPEGNRAYGRCLGVMRYRLEDPEAVIRYRLEDPEAREAAERPAEGWTEI